MKAWASAVDAPFIGLKYIFPEVGFGDLPNFLNIRDLASQST